MHGGWPVSPDDFAAKWAAEADTMRQRGATVNGAALLDEVLRDFQEATRGHNDELLNLTEAAEESGYSADYLGSLVRQGRIANAGRPHAPRIRRRDLPRKACQLPPPERPVRLMGATPVQIARAVVDSKKGAAR